MKNEILLLCLVLLILSLVGLTHAQGSTEEVDPKIQAEIDDAVAAGKPITQEQFEQASEQAQLQYVLSNNFDALDQNQRKKFMDIFYSIDKITPQIEKNLKMLMQTEDFSSQESKSFIFSLASKDIRFINENLDYFRKFAKAVYKVEFDSFATALQMNDPRQKILVFYTVGNKASQLNFEDLQKYAEQNFKISVGKDGEIILRKEVLGKDGQKSMKEIQLSNVVYKTEKSKDGAFEFYKREFIGVVSYSPNKPPLVVPACEGCSATIEPDASLTVKGAGIPLPGKAMLAGFRDEWILTAELKELVQSNMESLKQIGVSVQITSDKIILIRKFGEANIEEDKLYINPFSSVITADGIFKLSGIKKTKTALEQDTRSAALYLDNLDHANEASSYIQVSPENGRAKIVARYGQHIIAELNTNKDGSSAHNFQVLEIDSLAGRAEIREGRSVTVSEFGGIRSKHLPQTFIITSTGYFASNKDIGACDDRCYSVVKSFGVNMGPALAAEVQKLQKQYAAIKDTDNKLDVSRYDAKQLVQSLVSIYSLDSSTKVLDALSSKFGQDSLPLFESMATAADGSNIKAQIIEKIHMLNTDESQRAIAAYLEDPYLKTPTMVALSKQNDPRALQFFRDILHERVKIMAYELSNLVSALREANSEQADSLVSDALKSNNKEIRYQTALVVSKGETKFADARIALLEIVKDDKANKYERETAVRQLAEYNNAESKRGLERILQTGSTESKEIVAKALIPSSEPVNSPEEMKKWFFSRLSESGRKEIISIWSGMLQKENIESDDRQKLANIAFTFATMDDPDTISILQERLNGKHRQAALLVALGIAMAEKQNDYEGVGQKLAEVVANKETRLWEKNSALSGIEKLPEDSSRPMLSFVFRSSTDDQLQQEAALRLARLGDSSVLGFVLRKIQEASMKGLMYSEVGPNYVPEAVLERTEPDRNYLGALESISLANRMDMRDMLKRLPSNGDSTADFIGSLRKLSLEYGYVFRANDYFSISEVAKNLEFFSVLAQRRQYLADNSFSFKDASIILNAPEELLAKSDAQLNQELDKIFARVDSQRQNYISSSFYRADWEFARDKIDKLERVKLLLVAQAWQEGRFEIRYDENNARKPEWAGKRLSYSQFFELDKEQKGSELGGVLAYEKGKFTLIVKDSEQTKNNNAYLGDSTNLDRTRIAGHFHSHGEGQDPLQSGPSCRLVGSASDCYAALAQNLDEFVVNSVNKCEVTLAWVNPRNMVLGVGRINHCTKQLVQN